MKKQGWSFEGFLDATRDKRVVAFAASAFLQVIADNYKELCLGDKIDYIVDNNPERENQTFIVQGMEKCIKSIPYLINDNLDEIVILIGTDRYAYEVVKQLEQIEIFSNVICYVLPLMIANRKDDPVFQIDNTYKKGDNLIPKIIHCFWLGSEPLDDMAQNCLGSFRKYCPDYDIKIWTYKNYDVTKNQFMYEAYRAGKWAYACDYARLDKLYEEGGIYIDLDVELFTNIDVLLDNEFFAGFGPIRDIELAVFGSVKNNELVKEMLHVYDEKVFDSNRKMGLKDVQPLLMDRILEKKGFSINGKFQSISGYTLYPREVFSARNWFTGEIKRDKNSLGIHRCAGSWIDKQEKNIDIKRGNLLKEIEFIFTNDKETD